MWYGCCCRVLGAESHRYVVNWLRTNILTTNRHISPSSREGFCGVLAYRFFKSQKVADVEDLASTLMPPNPAALVFVRTHKVDSTAQALIRLASSSITQLKVDFLF